MITHRHKQIKEKPPTPLHLHLHCPASLKRPAAPNDKRQVVRS
jgi:hypothetical protein